MTREIKFRMWNPETRVMVDLKTITPLAVHPDLLKDNLDGLFIPFKDDYPLMQFTGLHDKNGKEIYEGDILNCTRMTDTTIGYYDEDPDTGDAVARHLVEWDSRFAWFTIPDQIEFWEVIGNLYENPELLEAIS